MLVKMRDITTKKTILRLIGSDEVDPALLEYLVSAFASLMLGTNSIQPHYDPEQDELSWDVIHTGLDGIGEDDGGIFVNVDPTTGIAINDDNKVVVDLTGVTVSSEATENSELLLNDNGSMRKMAMYRLANLVNRIWYPVDITTKPTDRKESNQDFSLRISQLNGTPAGYNASNNIHVKLGSGWECYGMISYMGGSIGLTDATHVDWNNFIAREVLIDCPNGGWFALQNGGSLTPTDAKKIYTGTGKDLHGLCKAVLFYDNTASVECWKVKSYEYVKYDIRTTSAGNSWQTAGLQEFLLPVAGLDIEGYYDIDVKVVVAERFVGPPIRSAPTMIPQTLVVNDNVGGETVPVWESPVAGSYGGTPLSFYNTCLGGGCELHVTGDTKDVRQIKVMVNLPNGDQGNVTSIRLHARYKGYYLSSES